VEDEIQKQFLHIQELVDTYTETLLTSRSDDESDLICMLADEAMGALLEMGMEGTGHCPCCGEAGQVIEHPEETKTTYYSNILLEHNLEDSTSRATLYILDDIEAVGDWEPVDPKEHAAIDVINCVSNLLDKLKLKHGKTDAT
jgi:hypothetical protein